MLGPLYGRIIRELERLEPDLHDVWSAGRDDAAARQRMKRLLTLCGEVTGAHHKDRFGDPMRGWKRYMQEVAEEDCAFVHLGGLQHGYDHEVVRGKRKKVRTFPPVAAPDAARACLDVIQVYKNDVYRATHREEQPATSEIWAKLRDFPKQRRSAIAKAGTRGTIRTRTAPGQRERLYSVKDVVDRYGDSAQPVPKQRSVRDK